MTKILKIIRGNLQFAQPDILHFIGHGVTTMRHAVSNELHIMPLLFTTPSGNSSGTESRIPELYNHNCISFMLRQSINVDGKPRFLVLQACETASFARYLVSICPKLIVVAWVTQLLDAACYVFSKVFYETLFALLHKKRALRVADIVDTFASTRIWLLKDVSWGRALSAEGTHEGTHAKRATRAKRPVMLDARALRSP